VLFIVVPLVEIYLLIELGQVIGALATVGLCVLTAVVGGGLLRYQGVQTMLRAQNNLRQGQLPAIELFEGVALAVGGALLLTPGLVTDIFGFLCLIPWTRRMMIYAAMRRMHVTYGPPGGFGGSASGPDSRSPHETLEGEFEHRDRR
jgi:UPF0716 protein FxsA